MDDLVNSLCYKIFQCKNNVTEQLGLVYDDNCSYLELFEKAFSENGENWASLLQINQLTMDNYYSKDEFECWKKFNLFEFIWEFIRLYDYQLRCWEDEAYYLEVDNLYCWTSPEIYFNVKLLGKTKIIEVLAKNDYLHDVDIFLGKTQENNVIWVGDCIWVVKFVENYTIDRDYVEVSLNMITPEIEQHIKTKCKNLQQIVGWNAEVVSGVLFDVSPNNIPLATAINCIIQRDYSVLIDLLKQNNQFMLLSNEFGVICELYNKIPDIFGEMTSYFVGKYPNLDALIQEYDTDTFYLNSEENIVVRFHYDNDKWWIEAWIKSLRLDWGFMVSIGEQFWDNGFIVFQFTKEWPNELWFNSFLEKLKETDDKENFYLYLEASD